MVKLPELTQKFSVSWCKNEVPSQPSLLIVADSTCVGYTKPYKETINLQS